uniref:Nudc_N domain-containing protein n=1 Tax=Glossina austeni TaxID=7395 RepID=A0A1A9V4F2_GLOAU
MSNSDGQYDHIFLAMAQKHVGGMPDFLRTFAGFLRRKSDFFSGDWEQFMMDIFRKEAEIAMSDQTEKLKQQEQDKKIRQDKEEEVRAAAAAAAREKQISDQKICDITDEEAAEIIKEEESKKRQKLLEESTAPDGTAPIMINDDMSKPIEKVEDDSEKDEIGKLLPNAGNGCTLDKYMWTQTLGEIEFIDKNMTLFLEV